MRGEYCGPDPPKRETASGPGGSLRITSNVNGTNAALNTGRRAPAQGTGYDAGDGGSFVNTTAIKAAVAGREGEVRWCGRIHQCCTSLAVAIRFSDMPALTPSRANSTACCTVEINSAEIGYCDN